MSEFVNSEIQTPPPGLPCCAVSVVIPMFNAEKFVGECLESLLAQTFKNFEVVIVDDCSTDSSCAIVQSYAEKFGERLTLTHMEKNSGGCALPRNKGLLLSRGEYIFFMDADDLFKPTALEELYTLAKNFDADVVYCEKFYELNPATKTFKVTAVQSGGFVDKPTLETEDLAQRFQGIFRNRYWVTTWCKLVRRNLLIEHEIFFPPTAASEDDIWTLGLVFYAKKFLRVPNVVYLQRLSEGSITRKERTPEQKVTFWMSAVLFGLKTLDKYMSKIEFFQKNPNCRYILLESFAQSKIFASHKDNRDMLPFEIYEAIKKEFSAKFGEHDVLVCTLCTYATTLRRMNYGNIQKFNQLAEQAQQRITQLEAELAKRN